MRRFRGNFREILRAADAGNRFVGLVGKCTGKLRLHLYDVWGEGRVTRIVEGGSKSKYWYVVKEN